MYLDLTNCDCCCITPRLMIQIKHLTSVLSSVCCGYTWDLQSTGRRHNISYTLTKLHCVLIKKKIYL